MLVLVCPSLEVADSREVYAESITAESDIYEDPATTHEGIIPNLDPLNLQTYLVMSSMFNVLLLILSFV